MLLSAVKLLLVVISLATAQAPGDEDDRCTVDHTSPQVYPDNVKTLMDSYNYEQLLPGNGTGNSLIVNAVWNDRSYDGNDVTNRSHPTYWQHSGAGGICMRQTRVCGFREGAAQNNWLFTQHIDKSVDPSLDNYPVQIRATIKYAFGSCRERHGCLPQFKIHLYKTNSQRLPSISGAGFMNRNNYVHLRTVDITEQSLTYDEVVTFEMQPGETGFYIAIQDEGTCVGVSRILVQRFNCKPFQDGLVIYPESPAPVSRSAPITVSCVSNGAISGSATVTCSSEGEWGPQTPTCGCTPGYEVDVVSQKSCNICPEGEYQALLSGVEPCKPCPGQSSADEEGTGVCQCDDTFIRHPDRPDDSCIRSPSAPLFDLNSPPMLDGTDVILVWLPSDDPGGDPSNLYYDVYAAQLGGDNPTFRRQNDGPIDKSCGERGDCRYTLTGLDANSSYSILIVAANSATDDPETVVDVTPLGSRYLVLVVGTEDAKDDSPTVVRTEDAKDDALTAGAAAGISFIATLVFTAVVMSLIFIAIIYFCCLKRSSHSYSSSSSKYNTNGSSDNRDTTAVSINLDEKQDPTYEKDPTSSSPWGSEPSKPVTAKKPHVPSRPMAPPSKPSVPQGPTPPSHVHAHSRPHNGY